MTEYVFIVVLMLAGSIVNTEFVLRRQERRFKAERDDLNLNLQRLFATNKDLLDRLFQSKAMPPSGVDLTQIYEERKQKDREHKEHSGKNVPPGPLERLTDKWKEKDLKAAEKGIDYTKPKDHAN